MKLINLLESPVNIGNYKKHKKTLKYEDYEVIFYDNRSKCILKTSFYHQFPKNNINIEINLLEFEFKDNNTMIYFLERKDNNKYIGFVEFELLEDKFKNLISHYNNPIRIANSYLICSKDTTDSEIKSYRKKGLGKWIYHYLLMNDKKSVISGFTQTTGSIELWKSLYNKYKDHVNVDVISLRKDKILIKNIDIVRDYKVIWNTCLDEIKKYKEPIKIISRLKDRGIHDNHTDEDISKIIDILDNHRYDNILMKSTYEQLVFKHLIMYKKD